MSAATAVELNAVLSRRLRPQDQRRVQRLLAEWRIELVAFDAAQAAATNRAYRDFDRGSGHPAALNLGDLLLRRRHRRTAARCRRRVHPYRRHRLSALNMPTAPI